MIARTVAAAAASLALAVGSAGCLSFYEIAVETPIQAKLDVSPFQRVLVAGFVTGGSRNIDPNTETARLLRSQLRTKSDLKVIDADVMQLAEEIDRRRGVAQTPNPTDEPRIKNEQDLVAYEEIFKDAEYWKKIGAEFQMPLIITGSVLFTEVEKSGVVNKPTSFVDSQGITRYQESRTYSDLKGYALSPKFMFIDGRTGQILYSEGFHEERLYPKDQNTPALSTYFELMDSLLPSFLNTLSTQRIRGTRILLK
jgi:hypothetical protein